MGVATGFSAVVTILIGESDGAWQQYGRSIHVGCRVEP